MISDIIPPLPDPWECHQYPMSPHQIMATALHSLCVKPVQPSDQVNYCLSVAASHNVIGRSRLCDRQM